MKFDPKTFRIYMIKTYVAENNTMTLPHIHLLFSKILNPNFDKSFIGTQCLGKYVEDISCQVLDNSRLFSYQWREIFRNKEWTQN